MFEVHQSHIKCYLRCRQQEHYRYRENLQRRKRPNPLIRGTIIHEMIEYRAGGKSPNIPLRAAEKEYAKLFREEKEEYGDLIGDIRLLMNHYFKWYDRDPIKPIKIKGKSAEHSFKVDLCKGIVLGGKIDLVGELRDERRWIVDHKSHKTLPKGDIYYSDIQGILYAWAFPIQYKMKVDGVVWNYIRFKSPTIPEVLKNGEMSRRQIDTLWPVYSDALISEGLNPKDYDDMKTKLEGNEASFFQRAYMPAHKSLITTVLEETKEIAQEMKQQKKPVRHLGRHCTWCEFYELCQAELRGYDAAAIRRVKFTERDNAKEASEKVEVD